MTGGSPDAVGFARRLPRENNLIGAATLPQNNLFQTVLVWHPGNLFYSPLARAGIENPLLR